MKRLLLCSTLLASGFVFAPNEAKAQDYSQCPSGSDAQSVSSSGYDPNESDPNFESYGAWVQAVAYAVDPSGCDRYTSDPDNFANNFTGELSDSGSANTTFSGTDPSIVVSSSASASIPSLTMTVSASIGNDQSSTLAITKAQIYDVIVFDEPPEVGDEMTLTVCSDFSSSYSDDFVYGGANADVRFNSGNASGAASVNNTSTGNACQTSTIPLGPTYHSFRFGASVDPGIGEQVQIIEKPDPEPDLTIYNRQGTTTATVTVSLPVGCTSYSGSFPGCNGKPRSLAASIPEKDESDETPTACASGSGGSGEEGGISGGGNGINTFAGNPINYAYGYKYQRELDYAGGALSFERVYRSDMYWLGDEVGKRWRHNFYRDMDIEDYPEKINLTDGTGALTTFFVDDLGVWTAQDGDITATITSWTDGVIEFGYIYTTDSDTKEYYDLDGHMVRIEYVGSEAVDLTYDTNGNLSTVTDEQGRSLTFTYETYFVGGGDPTTYYRIDRVTTPDGDFDYTYDRFHRLTSVTQPDATTRTYHYEKPLGINLYALTGITDERGIRISTYDYNDQGFAISSKGADNKNEYTFVYNADDTTTVTNPLGKQTIYTFETIEGQRKLVDVQGVASTYCPASGKTYAYDTRGFMTSMTDWLGRVTNYDRDGLGLPTKITQAAGTTAERVIDVTYKADTRLPTLVTENGRTTSYVYDTDNRVTSMTVTDTSGGSRTTTYSYHPNTTDSNGNTILGRLASIDGPRGDVTDTVTFTYDSNNRLTKTTNALGHEFETTSFDSADRPLTVVDANGVEARFVYDSMGRLTSVTEGFGTSEAQTTDYVYNDNGQVFQVTPENDAWLRYYYTDQGWSRSMRDRLDGRWLERDDAGNVTLETRKKIAPGTPNSYGHWWFYDELSRVRYERTHLWYQKTEYAYDVNSNVTSITDPNDNTSSFSYDGLDRLTSMTDALSGVTSFGINDLDHVESVTNARGHTTSYDVNAFGEDTDEDSPDRGTVDYVRDDAGNITQMTDARGEVTNYTYDAINRLTAMSYPSDTSLNVSMTYDSCTYGVGRLCSVTDASGTTAYTYDALGRLTQAVETRGALSFTTSYDYDSAGVLNSITLPSGRVISYDLLENAQIEKITAQVNGSNTTIIDNAYYLAFGPLSTMDYGNGKSLSNTYDLDHRIQDRTITGGTMSYAYTHDDNGNITAKGATSYTYDDLNRLTVEDGDNYAYDATHNRTSGKGVSYTIDSSSNRVTAIGGTSVTTDAAGQITAQTVSATPLTYTYDAAGRIETVSDSSGVLATYTYDAQNLRTKKVLDDGTTTHYVYGAGGLLSGEYDNTGGLIREYVYHYGEPVAQIDGGVSETLIYLHTDHLGTPRVASNTSGIQVWSWDSDAFGVGAPTGTAEVNLRFAGQYFDAESGLHYNWNRYYNSATGRYVSSDPIGLEGGINTYGYVEANPLMYIDPEGFAKKKKPKGYGPSGGSEHKKKKRKSTKKKHQEGRKKVDDSRGREKGDTERRKPRKKPDGYKGPWPPRIFPPIFPGNICVLFPQYCGDPNMAFSRDPFKDPFDEELEEKICSN